MVKVVGTRVQHVGEGGVQHIGRGNRCVRCLHMPQGVLL